MRRRPIRRPAVVLAAILLLGLGVAPAASEEGTPAPAELTTTQEVVGTTVEGRPIVLWHRARPGATERLLVLGSMHGNERAGSRVVGRLLERANLPANLDLWMIRTVNPDGAEADRRTNAHGVDLNRNFPYRWRPSARGLTWSGPEPWSEPESVALRDVVRRVQPWLVVSFHQPLFGVGTQDGRMPLVRALAEGMRLPVRDFVCTGICRGTFTGWVNNRTDGVAVTVEFARSVPQWRINRAARTVVEVGSRQQP